MPPQLACGGSDDTSTSTNLTPTTPVAHGSAPTSVIGGHSYIINFSSSGGTGITYTASPSANGSTAVLSDPKTGAVTYKPALAYNGSDIITVTAKNTEGAESQPGHLTVNVTPNTSPALPDRAYSATLSVTDGIKVSATKDVPLSGFLLKDSDGDTITWSVTGGTLGTTGGSFNGGTLTINTAGKAYGNYTLEIRATESFNGTQVTATPYTLNVIVGATSEIGGGGTQPAGEATITTELENNLFYVVQGLANNRAFWARTSQSGTVNATKWDVKAGVGPEGLSLNGADFEAWISTTGNQMPTTAQGYSDIFVAAVTAQSAEDGQSARPFGELWVRPKSTVAVGDTTKWLTVVAEFEDGVKANKSWRIDIQSNSAPTLTQGGTPTINATVKTAPWNSGQDTTFVSDHVVFQSTKNGSLPLTYKIELPTGASAPTVNDNNFPAGDRVAVELVDIKLGSVDITSDFKASWNKGTVNTLNGNTKTSSDKARTITGPIEFQVPLDTYTGTGNNLVFRYRITDGAGLPGNTSPLYYTITLPTSKNPEPIIDAFDATDSEWEPSSGDMRTVNGLTGWVSSQPSAGQSNQWTILHNGATPSKLRVANPIPTTSPAIATAWKVYMRTNDNNATWPVLPTTLVAPDDRWTIDWTPVDPTDARTEYNFTLNAWNQYGAKGESFAMHGQVWGRVIGDPVSKKVYLSSAREANNGDPMMSYPANFASWVDLKIAPRFDSADALYPNQYGFDPGDPLNPPGYWNVEKKPGNDNSAWRSSAVPPGHYLISARDRDIVGQEVINPIIGTAITGTYITNPANPYQVPRTRPTYAYIQNDNPDLTTHVPYGALAGAVDTSITYNVNGELDADEDSWYPGYWLENLVPVHFTLFDDANDPDYNAAKFSNWKGEETLLKLDDVKFSGAMTLVGEGDLTGKGGVIQFVFRDTSQKAFFDVVKLENLPSGLDRYPVEAYDKKDFTWTGVPGFATEVRVDPSDGGLSYRNIAFTLGNVGTGNPADYDSDLIGSGPLAYKTLRSDQLTLLAMKREQSAVAGFNYWRATRTAAPLSIPDINTGHNTEVKLSSSYAPTENGGVFNAIINRNSFIADLPFINGTNIAATTLKDTLQVVAYTSGTDLGPVDNINGLPTLIEFGQLAGNAGIPANFTSTANLGNVIVPRPDPDYWYGDTTPVVHYTVNYTGTDGLPGSMGVATTNLSYTSNDPLSRGLAPITNVKITTKAWDANKSTIDASSSPITVYKATANSTTGTNIASGVAVKAFNNDGQDFHSVWLSWKNPKDNAGKALNSGTIIEIFDLGNTTVTAAGGVEYVAPLFKVHVAPDVEEFPIPNAWVAALSGITIAADVDSNTSDYIPANNGDVASDPSSIVIRLRAVRYGDETAGNFVNFDKSPFKAAFPAYWIDTITSKLDFTATEVGKITVWEEDMTVNLNPNTLTGTYSNGDIQLRTGDNTSLKFTVDGSTASDRNGTFNYTWKVKSVTPDAPFVGTPTAAQSANLFQFVGTGANDGSGTVADPYSLTAATLAPPAIKISTTGAPFLANAKSANLVLELTIRKGGTTTDNVVDVPVTLDAAWWLSPTFTLEPVATVGNTITNFATDLAVGATNAPKPIIWNNATPLGINILNGSTNVTPGTTGLTYKWEVKPGTVVAYSGATNTTPGNPVNTIITAQTDVVLIPTVDTAKSTQSTLALPSVQIINNNNLWTPSTAVNRVTFDLQCQVYWNGEYKGTTTNTLPVDFRPAATQTPWSDIKAIKLNESQEDGHGIIATMSALYGTPLTPPTVPLNLQVTKSATTSSAITWQPSTDPGLNLATLTPGGDFGARWVIDGTPVARDADGNIVNNIAWNMSGADAMITIPASYSAVDVSMPGPVTVVSSKAQSVFETNGVRTVDVFLRYQVKPATGATTVLTSVNTYKLTLQVPVTVSNDWTAVASVSFKPGSTVSAHLEGATELTLAASPAIATAADLVFKNAAGNPLLGLTYGGNTYQWTVDTVQAYKLTNGVLTAYAPVGITSSSKNTILTDGTNVVTLPKITLPAATVADADILKLVVGLKLKVTNATKNYTTDPILVTFAPDITDVTKITWTTGTPLTASPSNDYKTGVAAAMTLATPTPSVSNLVFNAGAKDITSVIDTSALTYTWAPLGNTTFLYSLAGTDKTSTITGHVTPALAASGVTTVLPALTFPQVTLTNNGTDLFGVAYDKVVIPFKLTVSSKDVQQSANTDPAPVAITFKVVVP